MFLIFSSKVSNSVLKVDIDVIPLKEDEKGHNNQYSTHNDGIEDNILVIYRYLLMSLIEEVLEFTRF